MKTAGQEFLEWYNNYVKEYGCSPSDYDVNYFFKHNYLELEKQQIIDAIVESNKSNNRNVSLNPEQYYNETFKKIINE